MQGTGIIEEKYKIIEKVVSTCWTDGRAKRSFLCGLWPFIYNIHPFWKTRRLLLQFLRTQHLSAQNLSQMLIAHVNTVNEWAEIHHWMSLEGTTASLESRFSVFCTDQAWEQRAQWVFVSCCLICRNATSGKSSVELLWPHLFCLGF